MSAESPSSFELLVTEANRQLDICNACRYCEGYCAVFPALERRTLLDSGDITQIANLCHDCRACFDACMYAPPHEFDVNIPKVLSQVRLQSYERYVWPDRVPRMLRGWSGIVVGVLVSTAAVLAIALGYVGPSGLIKEPTDAASPYDVIPYPTLLALLLIAAGFSVAVMAVAARRYWVHVGGERSKVSLHALWRAVVHSLTLHNLRGGGGECYYPRDDAPSPIRRHLHALVAYGFGLCVLSTSSAAVLQDVLGKQPPYPLLSIPVVSGILGGIGIVVGCAGLLWLKAHSSEVTGFAQMTIKDYGLLVALTFLASSGLVTLFTRDTAAYGPVYVVHLAAIVLTFAAAPYTKFVHVIFRFLALVRDNLETESVTVSDSAAPPAVEGTGAWPLMQ